MNGNLSFLCIISEEEVENAVSYAQAKEFVEQKEGGYLEHLNIKGAKCSISNTVSIF